MEKVLGQTTVAWQDPLLSKSRDLALPESNDEELSVKVHAGNRADHKKYVGGLAELESEPSRSASQPDCCSELVSTSNFCGVLQFGCDSTFGS